MTEKIKETGLISEKLQFIAELTRTSAWIANRYTIFLKPYGISTQQFNILRVLRTANDWVVTSEVNELMFIKSPNITRLVDKLVTKGLVIRDRCIDDRRVVYIKITDSGKKLLSEIDLEHEGELSAYMDLFTIEQAVMMTKILKEMRI